MSLFDGIHIIGLTGQSGAGKTTVSSIIKELGIAVVDADAIARHVAEFPDFLEEVKCLYSDCVDTSGLLRHKLASKVFNDPVKLKSYTDIIYPYITKVIFNTIVYLKNEGIKTIVIDAPTLFESGLDGLCEFIVSVIAPMDVKIKRILERDGIPVEMVSSRINSQKSDNWFISHSDYIINNYLDLSELKKQTESVIKSIEGRINV